MLKLSLSNSQIISMIKLSLKRQKQRDEIGLIIHLLSLSHRH